MGNPYFPKELIEMKWIAEPCPTEEFLSEEFLHKHSASSKILNDSFAQVWSSDSEEENDSKKETHPGQPKYRKTFDSRLRSTYKPFKAYPKPSCLTATQQESFLQLMKKFNNNHSPFLNKQDQQDLQYFQTLQQKVSGEQVEYLGFLKDFALSNQSRYSSINPNIKKYINELWESQLKSCLRYPQFYRAHRTVALVLASRGRFDLIPGDAILEMGKICKLNLKRKKLKINSDYSTFVQTHPIIDYKNTNNEKEAIIKCPVSHDQNAEVIAKTMNVDFVLSSSSLKRICDNYAPFNKSWELPVTVKEIEIEESGHLIKKRVVFIDKALPRKKLTVMDRILWFHKIAIKRHLVKDPNFPRNTLTLDRNKRMKKGPQADKCLFGDINNVNEQDCFGVDGPISAESKLGGRTSGELKSSRNVEPEDNASEQTMGSDSVSSGENVDSSLCTNSDSENDKLVIDDPETSNYAKHFKDPKDSNASRKESIESKAVVSSVTGGNEIPSEDQSKPLTRRMAKMLENLNKMQKMGSNKRPSTDEKLPRLKNVKHSSLENLDGVDCEKSYVQDGRNDESRGDQNDSTVGRNEDNEIINSQLSLLDEALLDKDGVSDGKQQKLNHSNHRIRQGKGVFLPNYEPLPPAGDANFVYRLFSLKKKGTTELGFRLLIRCKLDAQEFVQKPKPKTRIATIVPKLEFQPEFGAEAVTVSELTSHWLSVQIRPNSFLVRARINAFTSDVMMIEEKERKDFCKEEKYLGTQASCCLNTLDAVLHGVADLPPGQYILSHEPKMGAFANLYCAAIDRRNDLYDLYKQYDVDPKKEEPQMLSTSWIPIDFTVITPLHDMLARVPGTFNPKNKSNLRKKSKKKKRAN